MTDRSVIDYTSLFSYVQVQVCAFPSALPSNDGESEGCPGKGFQISQAFSLYKTNLRGLVSWVMYICKQDRVPK